MAEAQHQPNLSMLPEPLAAEALMMEFNQAMQHPASILTSALMESSNSTSMDLHGPKTIADQISYQLAQMDQSNNEWYQQQQQQLTNGDLIDHSYAYTTEQVVEISPHKRYGRLNTLLGKGAFKVVHKAIDRDEGYEVAWNVLQIGERDDDKDMGHEIEILKSVRHPNIIAFHDAWIGESQTEFVFVTELMTSGTLREYIRKLSIPTSKIVKRWSRQILKGLAYLHSHHPPIIHRDIKCDNIFINGAHGEIKIGDMGTAENLWLGKKKYTLIGTPEFMAPEMYEERGYSEKVDLYAFGMCLLEMVTSEYPYSECSNAAQIYKKVSQHIKPESLSKVQDQQVLEVINNCLSIDENERLSAQELLESSFLAVEPDVVLLATDPSHKILTLQVVFKGSDKLSVKFEFNIEKDTAAEVVTEMIDENVLPERYQQWITDEINRILRDICKNGEDDKLSIQDTHAVWRREKDIRTELANAKEELARMTERMAESEKRRETLEQQMIQAEERYCQVTQEIDRLANHKRSRTWTCSVQSPDTGSYGENDQDASPYPISKGYAADVSIDDFVRDTAVATNRNREKAMEWAAKLKDQDIMTVGDLSGLQDEDWAGIGLTVFAVRALKNMLVIQPSKPPVTPDHSQ
ncbi:kinase-like domain-containing protein [Radiomyces spectabilis]|uniref:kinase-like domain-containing protein n=1 Tax=Radiomyces spectabilis TaxID=64574 RepID=UPI00221E711F|nr:kinase-like domain-containing protein [Radiomyces spectabilis]KAI8374643.1 kinase-like domain-containing protein [Radiomyces spectabilis]